MRKHLLLLLVLQSFFLFSQDDIAIHEWKSHLVYKHGSDVTQSDDYVYYTSDFGIIKIDKENFSIELISKIEGLSDAEPTKICYSREKNLILIGYSNGNVDAYTENGVINIPYIKKNSVINGPKKILDIYTKGDFAYLSCNFGMVVIDLDNFLVSYTVFTDSEVKDVALYNGNIYMSTEDGILFLSESNQNPQNLFNWGNLELDGSGTYINNDLEVFHDSLFLDFNSQIGYLDENNDMIIYDDIRYHQFSVDTTINGVDTVVEVGKSMYPTFISGDGDNLMVGYFRENSGCVGTVVFHRDGEGLAKDGYCNCITIGSVMDQEGRIWFADVAKKVRYIDGIDNNACHYLEFNEPENKSIYNIAIEDDVVIGVSGGYNEDGAYTFNSSGIYTYKDREWTNIKSNNLPFENNDVIWDILDVEFHPDNDKVYFASLSAGVIEKDGENYTLYDATNTTMQEVVGDAGRTRVGGMAFDSEGNLWIANQHANNPIAVLKKDGSWQSFANPFGNSPFLDLLVDEQGYKWIIVSNEGGASAGVLVFDDGGTMNNTNDDRYRYIRPNNSAINNGSVIKCIAMDREGDIWVGTSAGVIVFECGSSVFDPEVCQGSKRKVDYEGDLAYLLETEEVTAIAIDGANRKWFGTNNGFFIQSPDGRVQLAHYTKDNSPLIDNSINTIAINPNDGEVFIGTESGIVSFRSKATEGRDDNFFADVVVFPNPVRPDYRGPIAIKGLATDANVKITDINSQLVFEGEALGGQFIWDGNDYTGRRVSTGVYLVYSTSNSFLEAPSAIVTKILFIN